MDHWNSSPVFLHSNPHPPPPRCIFQSFLQPAPSLLAPPTPAPSMGPRKRLFSGKAPLSSPLLISASGVPWAVGGLLSHLSRSVGGVSLTSQRAARVQDGICLLVQAQQSLAPPQHSPDVPNRCPLPGYPDPHTGPSLAPLLSPWFSFKRKMDKINSSHAVNDLFPQGVKSANCVL